MKSVSIIELGQYELMVPLVGGYLEAYALQDPILKSSYNFEKYSTTARTDRLSMMRRLCEMEADVYAFSCYIWNVAMMLSLVRELVVRRPSSQFILGGPQVMHRAERYLQPGWERVTVCNGEGEITFSDYLRELTEARPDLSRVPGISFWRDGSIVSTRERQRINELDGIPSPFLAELFDGQYSTTVIETNRGCPFHCGFCYWGAAINDRVYKFSEERIKDEINWISKKGIPFLYIADANWGMLKRDLDFSRFIAECRQKHEVPQMVYYAAAKNKPDNVTEINRIFRSANIITSQPISMQTLDDEALRAIDRQNIKASAYMQIQEHLKVLKISSYSELIWPLPGETLKSFRTGIQQLCRMGSSTIVVYAHLLLPNTPLYKRREELSLVVTKIEDEVGEAEVVTQTARVSRQEFDQGMLYFYSALLLHNIRGSYFLATYLDRRGIVSYEEFFLEFVEFCREITGCPIVDFVRKSIATMDFWDSFNYGKLTHQSLHENRMAFEKLVYDFLSSRRYYHDETVRFLSEVDRVFCPYIYTTTPVDLGERPFEFLSVSSAGSRVLHISVPERFEELFVDIVAPLESGPERAGSYSVDHARFQYPYMKSRGLEHNAAYCQGMLIRVDTMVPKCMSLSGVDEAPTFQFQ